MAQVSKSRASIILSGDNLKPQHISDLLRCEGTTMYTKGDIRVVKKSGRSVVKYLPIPINPRFLSR